MLKGTVKHCNQFFKKAFVFASVLSKLFKPSFILWTSLLKFTVTFYKEHAVQQHDLIAHSYFEKQILLGCHFPVNLRYLDASCDFPTKNKSLAYMIL